MRPNDILVEYKDNDAASRSAYVVARHGLSPSRGLRLAHPESRLNRLSVLAAPDDASTESALVALRADPDVQHAEPNYRRHALGVPNDSRFSDQWSLRNNGQVPLRGPMVGRQGADIAWSEGLDLVAAAGGFKSAVVVAVIDTGVDYTHSDLAGSIWTNPGEIAGNRIDDDANGYVDDVHGYNFVDNTPDPMDDYRASHGTHVAGIIGAISNNALGVAGVAPHVQIMPLKALDSGGEGTSAHVIEAIEYAVANGASIINASLGGEGTSRLEEQAVKDAVAGGVLVVVAAGNEHVDNGSIPTSPASIALDGLVTVGATERRDRLAEYSNWGLTTVHLGAPGDEILSTVRRNGYEYLSGTSMAAPAVTGAAAALLSLGRVMSPSEISRRLLEFVEPIPYLGCRTRSGGRLNIEALMNGLLGSDRVAPAPITDLTAIRTGSDMAALRFTAPGADGQSGTARAYEVRSYTGKTWPGFSGAERRCTTARPQAGGAIEYLSVDGLEPATSYLVQIRATDNTGNESLSNLVSLTTTAADPVAWSDDVETGSGSWTTQPIGQTWSVAACPGGRAGRCWVDSAAGNYANGAQNTLVSPVIDLTRAARARLSFEHRYDFEAGYDFGTVEFSRDDGPWEVIHRISGTHTEWSTRSLELSGATGGRIRLRFVVTSDEAETADGWAIDALRISYLDASTFDEVAFNDTFDGSSKWSFEGSWAVHNGTLSDSPYGNYPTQTLAATTLASPLDFSSVERAQLRFDATYAYEEGRDFLILEASTDGTFWNELARYTGPAAGSIPLRTESVNLDWFAGFPSVNLRLVLSSTMTDSADGVTIDNLRVEVKRTAVCGDGRTEGAEECDPGKGNGPEASCCLPTCRFAAANLACRPQSGECDLVEYCTGSSTACPTDKFVVAGVECRKSGGPCDDGELCSGASPSCPADKLSPAGTTCRAARGDCDWPEECDGLSANCPEDLLMGSSTLCREAAGECDLAEVCSGESPRCPQDRLVDAETECRAALGICDLPERCDGNSAQCPRDVFASSDTVCRTATCTNGVETSPARCDGSGQCPAALTRICAPFACAIGSCADFCSSETDCAEGMHCGSGNCLPKLELGLRCMNGTQCTSGNCVDGVCCSGPCDGACEACNATGSVGRCKPISGGPRGNRSCSGICSDGICSQVPTSSGGSASGGAYGIAAAEENAVFVQAGNSAHKGDDPGTSMIGSSTIGSNLGGARTGDYADGDTDDCECRTVGGVRNASSIGALLVLCSVGIVRRRALHTPTGRLSTLRRIHRH